MHWFETMSEARRLIERGEANIMTVANGVAVLVERVDAMESKIAAQHDLVNEALVTIAEIATRTYYAARPPTSLPDDVINAGVMDAMIERWPQGAIIGMSRYDRDLLNDLANLPAESIDTMIVRAQANADQSNASRVRMAASLALLNQEMDKRVKSRGKILSAKRRGGVNEE